MKKQNVLFLGFILISNNVFASNSEFEWQKNRLLSPSFQELQTEFVWMTVINYTNLPDVIINEALNKHFNRIQYMNFSKEEK